jgi:hypothetical protein
MVLDQEDHGVAEAATVVIISLYLKSITLKNRFSTINQHRLDSSQWEGIRDNPLLDNQLNLCTVDSSLVNSANNLLMVSNHNMDSHRGNLACNSSPANLANNHQWVWLHQELTHPAA